MTYTTQGVLETEELGRLLAEKLDTAKVQSAFIALFGEMGVGKTAFTRGFASYFGIGGVKSPTYTVVNEYRGRKDLFHFDMYRIDGEDDLYSIGFDDYIEREGYAIAEWSERIIDFLPNDLIRVTINRAPEDTEKRIITINMGKAYDYIGI